MTCQVVKMLTIDERFKVQQDAFDLMIQFFDRACVDKNVRAQRQFIKAAADIHRAIKPPAIGDIAGAGL